MKPGAVERYQCNDDECMTEFEVCLEPKVKGSKPPPGMDAKIVTHCPFCGSQDIEAL